jgi:O-antigen/teichoic acid export membrane protein
VPDEAASAADPAPSRRRTGGQAFWTLLSQGLSSIANFGLTIAVARVVDERVGGAYTYAFLIFSLTLGLMRAVTTDPLVIRFSAASRHLRAGAIRRAAGASLLLGMLASGLCLLGAWVAGDEIGSALAVLALVLPGQFLQDCWRSAAFAAQDARTAAVNDAVRLVVQFAAISACAVTGATELTWYMASWALGVWVAGVVGVFQFGLPAGWRRGARWLGENARLGVQLGGDFAINMGAVTLATSLLNGLVGLAAAGGLRFAQSILGPIQVLFGALPSFMLPALARRLAVHGPRSLRRPALLVSLGASSLSAVVVGAVLALPESVGRELLGASWDDARSVMLAVGVTQCIVGVAMGASLPLKAMGRSERLLRVTVVQAPLILGLAVAGALYGGVSGAAWGMTIAQGVGCVLVWASAYRAMSSGHAAEIVTRRTGE